jgi:hypothetical protein
VTGRRRWARPLIAGKSRVATILAERSRVCPKCEAPIGYPCRRWVGGRVGGEDIGGGYWRPMTSKVHDERKAPP